MPEARPHGMVSGPVVRLGVTGDLGRMDAIAVLNALQATVALLQRTGHRVLGARAEHLTWRLAGLRAGSITVLARPEGVDEADARKVTATFLEDLRRPAARLLDEDVSSLDYALRQLAQSGSGSLMFGLEGEPSEQDALLDPAVVLPELLDLPLERHHVIGSVVGRLDGINVHARREAGLYDDVDGRRVVVSFPEPLYESVHAALRGRVEAFGLMTEDPEGRIVRMRLDSLRRLPDEAELPTLSSLVGSVPDLTGELTAVEYLSRSRDELRLA